MAMSYEKIGLGMSANRVAVRRELSRLRVQRFREKRKQDEHDARRKQQKTFRSCEGQDENINSDSMRTRDTSDLSSSIGNLIGDYNYNNFSGN